MIKTRIMVVGAVTAMLFALAACGGSGGDNCSDEIKSAIKKYGEPEEVQRYDTEGYHSHSYWWWSQGFEYTYTWGSVVGGCQVSLYQFTPIYKERAALLKQRDPNFPFTNYTGAQAQQ